jgi:hypothetical protein
MDTLERFYLDAVEEERLHLERKLEQERKRSARLARTLRGLYRQGVQLERA